MLTGGAAGAAVTSGGGLDPVKSTPPMPLQPASATSVRITTGARSAGEGTASFLSISSSANYFIVGMTNSAPSLVPDGQRAVTVLVLV